MKKTVTSLLCITALIAIIQIVHSMSIYGTAPFCRIDNNGYMTQCYYYSMSSCRSGLTSGYFCTMR